LLEIKLGFELLVPNCLEFSRLQFRLQSKFQIASTMLTVYGHVWCVLHETSNACIIFIIWLFSIDYDAWRGTIDSTWGCSVDGAIAILMVSAIAALRYVCNAPIRHQSLSSSSHLHNNKYSCASGVVINSLSIMNNWRFT
jgi:hypothetical protein